MTNQTKTWREEFDEKFPELFYEIDDVKIPGYMKSVNSKDDVKQFISNLIEQIEKEAVGEEVSCVECGRFGGEACCCLEVNEKREQVQRAFNKYK